MLKKLSVRKAIKGEDGQSLTELAIGIPFLLLLALAVFEVGIIFATYISLINAAREGAVLASMHPEIRSSSHDNDALQPGNTPLWTEYENRIGQEIFQATTADLVASQILDEDPHDTWTPTRPFVLDEAHSNPGDPITVAVQIRLHTFTSNMSLPYFGRFGLPNYYTLWYTMSMPIR